MQRMASGQRFDSDRAAQVDAVFSRYDSRKSPGCALAIIQNGVSLYKRGYGMANLEYGVPIKPSTVFHVASVSKHFTAFAVQLLALDGLLTLDDDVRKYLPELHDFGAAIRIHHLIHHTSGLRDQWSLLNLAGWRMGDVITEEDILRLVWDQRELNFPPGEQELYSNTGYTLLGLIVKRVSGIPFRQFCEERIFRPLRMTRTHFHSDNTELVPGRAYSYDPFGDTGFCHSPLQYANAGATSLFTTVEDLARWDRNFYRPRVGGAKVQLEMHRKGVLSNGQEISYASGLAVGEYRGLRTVGHSGSDAGFRTEFLRFPDQRLTLVVLANLGSIAPWQLAREVADLFLGDRMSPSPTPPNPKPDTQSLADFAIDVAELQSLSGIYFSKELGVVYTVSISNGALQIRHPRGVLSLKPVSTDRFVSDYPVVDLRFVRSEDTNSIRGFRVSNGRVKDLFFERTDFEVCA